ncbi:electron transfer flavoprotein-ubiquinone oxidoreductase, partial [Pseudoalteromonas carrageenovora]|uniref:NAD(P)/FAD-dependent oxidoreductase n=1 Tax=Pseudoalteromonas carrageenovora TaxID=227 RepID=UPI0031270603
LHSLPKMNFAGGLLVGCYAGTLNFAKIKGNHTAKNSGMGAAEVIFDALQNNMANTYLTEFKTAFENSWAYK